MNISQKVNYVLFAGFTIIFFYLLIFMPNVRTLTTAELLMLIMGLGVVVIANMIKIDELTKKRKKK